LFASVAEQRRFGRYSTSRFELCILQSFLIDGTLRAWSKRLA